VVVVVERIRGPTTQPTTTTTDGEFGHGRRSQSTDHPISIEQSIARRAGGEEARQNNKANARPPCLKNLSAAAADCVPSLTKKATPPAFTNRSKRAMHALGELSSHGGTCSGDVVFLFCVRGWREKLKSVWVAFDW
jgi:hypothetical protein